MRDIVINMNLIISGLVLIILASCSTLVHQKTVGIHVSLLDNHNKKSNNNIKNKLEVQQWIPPIKNQLNIKVSIPEGNHFYINQHNGYGSSFGFLGISAGLEYFISDKASINMDIGTMTDFMLPIPAPVDYRGSYDRSFAAYMDLQIGKEFRFFHTDVGIQVNRTSYYERETVELFPEYYDTLRFSIKQINAGIALSGYYKITDTSIFDEMLVK